MNKQMLSYLSLLLMLTLHPDTHVPELVKEIPVAASIEHKPSGKGRNYYESRGEAVWDVPMNRKLVALTFDDGPDPNQTPEILDLLKKYDAKATFFVVGKKVALQPELLKREAKEGHEIANHTYNHIYFNYKVPVNKLEKEISDTHALIAKHTGQQPHLFRPPGGMFNEQLIQLAKEKGYLVVLWSWHQDTKDWRSPGVNFIVQKVLNNIRGGDIILFHDWVEGPKHSQTVEALKIILPALQEKGYSFVTVSQLIETNKIVPAKK
ncbi:polysaccharide deacetylase [Paenibacillus selenitireducens]|uniref:Polysaccharide deacetylase n=1 Tax=Paenibacillus selenitireducens TaxID=1324314 RepID=A0A1T2XLV0_9BACL|nr:polysaccharide deacetylase [Paenibacillus selenitireducens]